MFSPNDSPLAGRSGQHLTSTKIGERLQREADSSVSLRVLTGRGSSEAFEVQARGELQLGLLIGELNSSLRAPPVNSSVFMVSRSSAMRQS